MRDFVGWNVVAAGDLIRRRFLFLAERYRRAGTAGDWIVALSLPSGNAPGESGGGNSVSRRRWGV